MHDNYKNNNTSDSSLIGRVIENLTGYVDTKINLVKLDAQLKLRDAMVNAMHFGVLAITGLLTLLFLSITLGLFLNDLLDSRYLGFAIVTVIYLIPFIIALTNKDKTAFRKIADKAVSGSDDKETPEKK